MDEPPDAIGLQSFPQLAGALRRGVEKILQRWEAAVRRTLPAAEELTFAQLRDDMPRLLRRMAEAMEAARPAGAIGLPDASEPHGAARFHPHYNIDELMIEYHLLRQAVIEEAGSALGRRFEPAELAAIGLALDAAIRHAVVAYCEHQKRELQAAVELHSRYLSFLSHDLRGGLNSAVLMMGAMTRQLAGEPRLAEILADVDATRRSILATVDAMHLFLQAEMFRKGSVQVRPAQVDLRRLLEDQIALHSHQARVDPDKGSEAIDLTQGSR